MARHGETISGPDFIGLLNDVGEWCEEIERKVLALYEAARTEWPWLGTVVDAITGVLSKLKELWDKFTAIVKKLITNPGAPSTLWLHGNDWSGEPVGERISNQVGLATENAVLVDDHWTGPAAEAYTKMLGPQKDALAALKTTADDVDDLLFKTSGAVVALWGGVAVIISATLSALVADAIAAGTGIGTAPGVGAALLILKWATWALTATTGVAGSYFATEVLAGMKDVQQRLHDNSTFPGGHWPQTTTASTADGSITDGDTTSWRLKT